MHQTQPAQSWSLCFNTWLVSALTGFTVSLLEPSQSAFQKHIRRSLNTNSPSDTRFNVYQKRKLRCLPSFSSLGSLRVALAPSAFQGLVSMEEAVCVSQSSWVDILTCPQLPPGLSSQSFLTGQSQGGNTSQSLWQLAPLELWAVLPPEDHLASILPSSKVFYVDTSRWLHKGDRLLCSDVMSWWKVSRALVRCVLFSHWVDHKTAMDSPEGLWGDFFFAGNDAGRRAAQDKGVRGGECRPRGTLPHRHIGEWQSHLAGRFHNGGP